jgi:hypothetical protein
MRALSSISRVVMPAISLVRWSAEFGYSLYIELK